jgi:hypothetical protein
MTAATPPARPRPASCRPGVLVIIDDEKENDQEKEHDRSERKEFVWME